jgi:hypothetical protein
MVGTVVFPTLRGLRRASSRRQQLAGPVCCCLRATVWCPGCWPGRVAGKGRGSRRWSWTRRAGRVPVLHDPANGNQAVPLTYEQSRYGFANAAADIAGEQDHTVPLLRCRSGHSAAAA